VNEDWERVTPSDLLDYRVTHLLKAPCCLCPLKMGMDQYIESAIFIARRGRLQGEYIACCATDQCGYLGERSLYSFGPKCGLTERNGKLPWKGFTINEACLSKPISTEVRPTTTTGMQVFTDLDVLS
jgi:hypothetical protein